MATRRIATPCRNRACQRATTNANGYCDQCQQAKKRHQERPAGRGYDRAWRKQREMVLEADPWCLVCRDRSAYLNKLESAGAPADLFRSYLAGVQAGEASTYTAAALVDHLVPKAHGGCDEAWNLAPLCRSCHGYKTAWERTVDWRAA